MTSPSSRAIVRAESVQQSLSSMVTREVLRHDWRFGCVGDEGAVREFSCQDIASPSNLLPLFLHAAVGMASRTLQHPVMLYGRYSSEATCRVDLCILDPLLGRAPWEEYLRASLFWLAGQPKASGRIMLDRLYEEWVAAYESAAKLPNTLFSRLLPPPSPPPLWDVWPVPGNDPRPDGRNIPASVPAAAVDDPMHASVPGPVPATSPTGGDPAACWRLSEVMIDVMANHPNVHAWPWLEAHRLAGLDREASRDLRQDWAARLVLASAQRPGEDRQAYAALFAAMLHGEPVSETAVWLHHAVEHGVAWPLHALIQAGARPSLKWPRLMARVLEASRVAAPDFDNLFQSTEYFDLPGWLRLFKSAGQGLRTRAVAAALQDWLVGVSLAPASPAACARADMLFARDLLCARDFLHRPLAPDWGWRWVACGGPRLPCHSLAHLLFQQQLWDVFGQALDWSVEDTSGTTRFARLLETSPCQVPVRAKDTGEWTWPTAPSSFTWRQCAVYMLTRRQVPLPWHELDATHRWPCDLPYQGLHWEDIALLAELPPGARRDLGASEAPVALRALPSATLLGFSKSSPGTDWTKELFAARDRINRALGRRPWMLPSLAGLAVSTSDDILHVMDYTLGPDGQAPEPDYPARLDDPDSDGYSAIDDRLLEQLATVSDPDPVYATAYIERQRRRGIRVDISVEAWFAPLHRQADIDLQSVEPASTQSSGEAEAAPPLPQPDPPSAASAPLSHQPSATPPAAPSGETATWRLYTRADVQSMESNFQSAGNTADALRERIKKGVDKPGVALRPLAGVAALRQALPALAADFPHFAGPCRFIEDFVVLAEHSDKAFWLQPVLLVGPPGIGKTFFLRRLAEAAGTDFHALDLSTVTAGFYITGALRTWHGARPGWVFNKVFEGSRHANPVLLLDELDKAPRIQQAPVEQTLLGLLEPGTAGRFVDEFIELPMDLRKVVWVASANNLNDVSLPLRTRMRVFELDEPTFVQRAVMLGCVWRALRAENAWGAGLSEHLDDAVVAALAAVQSQARDCRNALMHAAASALAAGRPEITADDVAGWKPGRKGKIGFMA